MPEAFIYDHVRTPRGRGKSDGALHEVTALNLATQAVGAIKTRNKLDKDRFREDLGGLVDAYREVAQRLGILVETDNALTTGPRLVQ